MNYSSRLGCVTYYDNLLYRYSTCDPSMLFILGLEAIVSSDNYSDSKIIIPKYIENGNDRYEISAFNNIVKYLYPLVNIKDYADEFVEYSCGGLKNFINSLTGVGNKRVIPIIFNYSFLSSKIDVDWSDLDALSAKIHSIFEDAGKSYDEIHFASKFRVSDSDTLMAIDSYNKSLAELIYLKKNDSLVYTLLDYRAMYSYSLGVLYGLKCLGYDENLIWRFPPSVWMNSDKLYNLISTAYDSFKFHYSTPIERVDSDNRLFDSYKGIPHNSIWNFDGTDTSIKHDETLCYSVCIEDNNVNRLPILYSQSTGKSCIVPGSYLLVGSSEWSNLDSSVIDSETHRGIVPDNSINIVRYMINDEIIIVRAYKCYDNVYLSPNNIDNYFVYTGNLGWVNFNENSYELFSSTTPIPSFNKTGFSKISSDLIKFAREKATGNISVYYRCYISDDRSLFGIILNNVSSTDITSLSIHDDARFIEIISDYEFYNRYEFPIEV